MEVPTWPSRSSPRGGPNTPTDSPAELRKPAMGSAAHSRRTPEAGHRHPRNQCWQVYSPRPQGTVADLADLPGDNHVKSIVSIDFLRCRRFAFRGCTYSWSWHDRRRILHFAVTAHPTAEWTAQQLREAFPWDNVPRFVLRDRDRIFGFDFTQQVKALGVQEVLGAPHAPTQQAYIERVIGTIRRKCWTTLSS